MNSSEILLHLRKSKKLSQKFLADLLGVSTTAYQNYEYGKSELNYEGLNKLADFYEVTVDYLLGRETVTKEQEVLNKLTEEYNLSELDRLLVQTYISISPEERNKFMQTVQQIVTQKEEEEQSNRKCIVRRAGDIMDELHADEQADEKDGTGS